MTTAVATTPRGQSGAVQKSVKQWLGGDYFKQQVALTLPKHLTPDRFVRVCLSALTRVPKLAECTPQSVMKCMMTCSELGLEPDGRRAHLIPFGTECTLIVDYKGMVELAMNSGTVSSIFAQTVCDKDDFSYDTGEIHHKIDFRQPRGRMYAVYTVIQFKDGGKHTEVMTLEDVQRIRSRSKAANKGPWVTDFDEMAKKTVFRRAAKWIKLSPEVQDALDKEADVVPGSGIVAEVTSERQQLEAPPEEPEAKPEPEAIPVAATVQPDRQPKDAADEAAQAGAEADEAAAAEPAPEPAKAKPAAAPKATPPVIAALKNLVESSEFTWDHFAKWASDTGNVPDAASLSGFEEVPEAVAARLMRAQKGLLKGLSMAKQAAEGGVTP